MKFYDKIKRDSRSNASAAAVFGVGVAGYFHREIYLVVAGITGLVFFIILCYALFAEHMEKEQKQKRSKNNQTRRSSL